MEQSDHELLLPLVDEENICLPLPINVVSKYWNVELSMAEAEEIAKQYSGYNGSVLIEGIELAERQGLECKIIRSNLSELKKIINSGIPPIVLLPGIPEITQHASIITGYNDENKTIFHYVQKGNKEGEQQEGAIPQDLFEKEWSEEGRILIILGPPEILTSIKLENESYEKSNRLCLLSDKFNIKKNNNEAIQTLKKAIEIDQNNSNAMNLMGAMLNEQNSPECLSFYEKCLKLNNKSYLSYNGIGNFYLKSNQFKKAEDSYNKAIKLNPRRSAKIYKNRAYTREKLNKNSEAKEDLKTYLKLFPKASDRGIVEQAIREL